MYTYTLRETSLSSRYFSQIYKNYSVSVFFSGRKPLLPTSTFKVLHPSHDMSSFLILTKGEFVESIPASLGLDHDVSMIHDLRCECCVSSRHPSPPDEPHSRGSETLEPQPTYDGSLSCSRFRSSGRSF
ncbi:Uncharacterized protein HZ326_21951 [Fusarium oxysporum f. sp. albedinis]|nr:Uncharacterized protein HZ326_21951 [Fusarium oxysporum f. sp. albedinis]